MTEAVRNPSPIAASLTDQGLPPNYNFRPDWELTPRQVKALFDQKADFVFIDCRTPGEYAHCRIQGSKLVPLQEVAAHMETLDSLKNRKVVISCHHGMRSLRMTMALRQAGFTDVHSMAGGIDLWSIDIDSTIPRY